MNDSGKVFDLAEALVRATQSGLSEQDRFDLERATSEERLLAAGLARELLDIEFDASESIRKEQVRYWASARYEYLVRPHIGDGENPTLAEVYRRMDWPERGEVLLILEAVGETELVEVLKAIKL